MATFLELYGTELDRELGSADRSVLFTTARRQAAINAGQLEFLKRTECFTREGTVALVTATQEYDLEAAAGFTDFLQITAQGVSVKIVSGTTTRYLEGDRLTPTTVAALNQEQPNWRALSAGTPTQYYIRRHQGAINLGLVPAPSITGADTWTAIVPYLVLPADLSADADEPFTYSSNVVKSLRPWHRALVYFAAYDLEKYRKDLERQQFLLKAFEDQVQQWIGETKPKAGQTIRVLQDYRNRARWGSSSRLDPRRYP